MSDKDSNRKFMLEVVKVVLLIIAGGSALWRYYETTGNEFQKPLWSKEIELLFETSEVVATLACTTDQNVFEKATTRFWTLYYGPLCIVENGKLGTGMVKFGEELKRTNHRLPDDQTTLKEQALEIARACRAQVVDLVKAKGQIPGGFDKRPEELDPNDDKSSTRSKAGSDESKVDSDGR